jgi:hypothetical protein
MRAVLAGDARLPVILGDALILCGTAPPAHQSCAEVAASKASPELVH